MNTNAKTNLQLQSQAPTASSPGASKPLQERLREQATVGFYYNPTANSVELVHIIGCFGCYEPITYSRRYISEPISRAQLRSGLEEWTHKLPPYSHDTGPGGAQLCERCYKTWFTKGVEY